MKNVAQHNVNKIVLRSTASITVSDVVTCCGHKVTNNLLARRDCNLKSATETAVSADGQRCSSADLNNCLIRNKLTITDKCIQAVLLSVVESRDAPANVPC